jgi:site-specific DNA recombinase
MRLISYSRVSTEEQATEGISLSSQRARMEAYAAAMGHTIVAFVEDAGISAKTLNRPGIKRALKMLRAGEADGILITKLDRLTRRTRDMIELIDKYFATGKYALISLGESIDTASAMGRMILTFFAVIAEWERETIAERTRDALRHKKANGIKLGALPLGVRRVKDDRGVVVATVADESEQLVLKRALELADQGMKPTAIRAQLVADGLKPKRGGKWHLTTLRKLLARARATRENAAMLAVFIISLRLSWLGRLLHLVLT